MIRYHIYAGWLAVCGVICVMLRENGDRSQTCNNPEGVVFSSSLARPAKSFVGAAMTLASKSSQAEEIGRAIPTNFRQSKQSEGCTVSE